VLPYHYAYSDRHALDQAADGGDPASAIPSGGADSALSQWRPTFSESSAS